MCLCFKIWYGDFNIHRFFFFFFGVFGRAKNGINQCACCCILTTFSQSGFPLSAFFQCLDAVHVKKTLVLKLLSTLALIMKILWQLPLTISKWICSLFIVTCKFFISSFPSLDEDVVNIPDTDEDKGKSLQDGKKRKKFVPFMQKDRAPALAVQSEEDDDLYLYLHFISLVLLTSPYTV